MYCVFLTFCEFWNYYILKLLRLETITFSDATLSDINVVLCSVLSQYVQIPSILWRSGIWGTKTTQGHTEGHNLSLIGCKYKF